MALTSTRTTSTTTGIARDRMDAHHDGDTLGTFEVDEAFTAWLQQRTSDADLDVELLWELEEELTAGAARAA